MSFSRRTAVVLSTAAALGPASTAVAMPVRDVPGPVGTAPQAVVRPAAAAPVRSGGGTGTLTVVLLSAGALAAGGALGFGGARRREGRATLRPQ